MKKIILPSLIMAGVAARVLMVGMPNIEPVMLVTMLVAFRYGAMRGAATGFFVMLISDFYIGIPGPWTLFTAPAYGLVGFTAGLIGKHLKDRKCISLASVSGSLTVMYDIITSIAMALLFGIPIMASMVALIPFMALHVFGNMLIIVVVFPYAWKVLDIVEVKSKDFFAELFGARPSVKYNLKEREYE